MSKQAIWINDQVVASGQTQIDGQTIKLNRSMFTSDSLAEGNVLGIILNAGMVGQGNAAFKRAYRWVKPSTFYSSVNAFVFRAMERLVEQDMSIEFSTVRAQLDQVINGKNLLEVVGGDAYLKSLQDSATGHDVDSNARIVLEHSLGNGVRIACTNVLSVFEDGSKSIQEKADLASVLMRDGLVRVQAAQKQSIFDVNHLIEHRAARVIAEAEDDNFSPGIYTGFAGLDKALLGLQKNRLYIFGAPPGWGKTMWMLSLAMSSLRAGKRVAFVNLEMPMDELLDRLICMTAEVDNEMYQSRQMTTAEKQRVVLASREIVRLCNTGAFSIINLVSPTLEKMSADIDEAYQRGFDVLFIDYVIPEKLNDQGQFAGDKFGFMSQIYARLELYKREYDAAIVAATQMNQKWDSRRGKRPGDTDLYYGTMGRNVADVVAFIYHERYVKKTGRKESEIIIRKNRSGRMGDNILCLVDWQPQFYRFVPSTNANAERLDEGGDGDE